MKTILKFWMLPAVLALSTFAILGLSFAEAFSKSSEEEAPCVFMSIMGEQSVDGYGKFLLPQNLESATRMAEVWLADAQNIDGGWGAGSHTNQQERNPHAVASDPATTAMAAMALHRMGYSLTEGKYQKKLNAALEFILKEIESNQQTPFITKVRGTQIQRKLGEHIDAALALQYLNQVNEKNSNPQLRNRLNNAIQICVQKLEQSMDENGNTRNAGWAGVLQSSLANSSLEAAANNKAIKVDTLKLNKAKIQQQSKFDPGTGKADTKDGAGIVLYSVSSSVRNSAKDSRDADAIINKAKAEGKLRQADEISEENLIKAGVSADKAKQYNQAKKVYENGKVKATQSDVMAGFGNNGGEEFISFLQTGESMIINHDPQWKDWYNNIAGKLIKIQNKDGSWNGHHCITSPVFCTATCLLVLTVENDMALLQK